MELSRHLLLNTLWDLFLGVVPALLGRWLAAGLRRSRGIQAGLWLPVAVAWLLFLPNAPYLLTEIRHYLEENPIHLVSEEGRGAFLFWSGFYCAFSGSGLVLFALAIRPLAAWARERAPGLRLLAPLLFAVCSLGVYLGLRVRLNSWNVVTRPERVWEAAVDALLSPGGARWYILAFAGFLWLAYVVVDIWFDGLELRRKGGQAA